MGGNQEERVSEAVGRRVRDARTEHGWTLDQLAQRSGVSRRMIVNVESGASNASIATLLRLAEALHVSLADLVADTPGDRRIALTTAADREPLWSGQHGGRAVLVASADTPDMLELWEWTVEPGEEYESEAHRSGTRELLHVHSGHLTLTLDGTEHHLRRGDAASLLADAPHRYANNGRSTVRFSMTVFAPSSRVRP